jgi:hypothetical protein
VPTKTGHNDYDGYDYATLADYINAVDAALTREGVLLLCTIDGIDRLESRVTKAGSREYVVAVRLHTYAVHAESGACVCITAWGEGQDRGDKALNKAITAARKNALAMLLNLVATDDPERDSHESPAQESAPYQSAAEFLKELR